MFSKNALQWLTIWDLLEEQISCSAELRRKTFYNLGAWISLYFYYLDDPLVSNKIFIVFET